MDMREAKHQEAVTALLQNTQRIHLIVRHDPPPRGLQVIIHFVWLFYPLRICVAVHLYDVLY